MLQKCLPCTAEMPSVYLRCTSVGPIYEVCSFWLFVE
jgi:hypothetical protein